jgi:hypothetical protein
LVKVAARLYDFPEFLPRSMQPYLGIPLCDAEHLRDFIVT